MQRRTRRVVIGLIVAGWAACAAAAPPTEVKAFFRQGQTFLTWKEDGAAKGETYRVYRSDKPIADLVDAKVIAEVREGSSRFQEMWTRDRKALLSHRRKGGTPPWVVPRLCIEPVGDDNRPKMLPEDNGLLVWTVKEQNQTSYYAVTTVANGAEDKALGTGNTCGPVQEKRQPIGAVRYYVETGTPRRARDAKRRVDAAKKAGKEPNPRDVTRAAERRYRDWYIMWMDYELWNVDYIGYAFPIALTRARFKEGGPMPSMHLDGIGSMNAFAAWYSNYGQEDFSRNALPTWYFGYGTKVKDRASGMDVKQPIGNYVQYRIIQTARWARRKYKITDPRFYILGNSMGASGNIGLALAFPRFVTAIYSNEGLTDYADTFQIRHGRNIRLWASSICGNYGKVELKNPVKLLPFGDPQLDWYLKHDGMNVYDFRNARTFLAKNVDTDFPFLVIGHCHQDGSIPAKNQAYPFEEYIQDSRHTFSYSVHNGGHGWGNILTGTPMTQHVRWDESRPGFSGVPAVKGWRYNKLRPNSRTYCLKVAWGVKTRPVLKKHVVKETETSWSMPLRHTAKDGQEQDYFVDLTPRNLQVLKVAEGDAFTFAIKTLDGKPMTIEDFTKYANGETVKKGFQAAGDIVADEHGLLLVPNVPIHRAGCLVEVTLRKRGPQFAKRFGKDKP
jgi:hypothetical protein